MALAVSILLAAVVISAWTWVLLTAAYGFLLWQRQWLARPIVGPLLVDGALALTGPATWCVAIMAG